ncbi:hypothetical protein MKJ04_11480 [Pontibacter sp. E15-1]|uniref:hypothetical protein n=1 Tax=Pontibacter sp. E15-1 TaxID=2919918 RepID=UPI001F501A9F|nr:hypothetical protein [Pontibacter sp. E15-1]MCJ8165465.1 hypothetical protein [Pontibacter sp. E15-1]
MMAYNSNGNRRELLKSILRGSATVEELRQLVQGPALDYSLLTPDEFAALKDYEHRYGRDKAKCSPDDICTKQMDITFQSFTMHDLTLVTLLRWKATAEARKRYLLDRVDLTTLSEEEADVASTVVGRHWVKVLDMPEWLQE